MNFDIFKKLSDLPSELKIGAIYKEWCKELNNIYYKNRESELNSLKLADEFIINKNK
ncbi:hypothetical protein JXR93_11515 [bacterium]|nr:hypothetical protein [bacterium]